MSEPRYRRSPDVVQRRLGNDLVVLLPSDEATVLEGGSAAVWSALGTGSLTLTEVCARLGGDPRDAPDQTLVGAMLEELTRWGALETR